MAILSSPETTKTAVELVELLRADRLPGPAPANVPESVPEPMSAKQLNRWARILSVTFQLLILGLAVLFFFAAARAVLSRKHRSK